MDIKKSFEWIKSKEKCINNISKFNVEKSIGDYEKAGFESHILLMRKKI